eukprot:763256-Hanusia_phi.AAC.1
MTIAMRQLASNDEKGGRRVEGGGFRREDARQVSTGTHCTAVFMNPLSCNSPEMGCWQSFPLGERIRGKLYP